MDGRDDAVDGTITKKGIRSIGVKHWDHMSDTMEQSHAIGYTRRWNAMARNEMMEGGSRPCLKQMQIIIKVIIKSQLPDTV